MATQLNSPIRLLTYLSNLENVRVFQWVIDVANHTEVLLADLDYLLEIDVVSTFDSINLRSFHMNDVQSQIGDFVMAYEVSFPPRQLLEEPTYYWRVKIDSTNYYSNFTNGDVFVLNKNQRLDIFNRVFNALPDKYVYPKDAASTNVANILKAYCKELDKAEFELLRTKNDFFWKQARDSQLYNVAGVLYDLPKTTDLTFAEYRDLILEVSRIFDKTNTKQSIIDIVRWFVGIDPTIVEYVNTTFWRLDSNAGLVTPTDFNNHYNDGRVHYFLKDTLYPQLTPITIESKREKAFTWILYINNIFNASFSKTLLEQLIYAAMPAYTKVIFVYNIVSWGDSNYWGNGVYW